MVHFKEKVKVAYVKHCKIGYRSVLRNVFVFESYQGEGHYSGIPSLWFRFFGCPLNCHGFGQKDPTDPSTFILPYQDFDVSAVKTMEDLPVWNYGCDSSYSWASKFKGLAHNDTHEEIARQLVELMRSRLNPKARFVGVHPIAGPINTHMCWTGGEPLMPKHQGDVVAIWKEWQAMVNAPRFQTFETNGTQKLTDGFHDFFEFTPVETFFSVSPKLFTVSGEKAEKAIKPHIVAEYQWLSSHGQLKFVVGPEDRQWDELLLVIEQFRKAGVQYPVWIMSVGATVEGQHDVQERVANRALLEGFNYTTRSHVEIWGNRIGT